MTYILDITSRQLGALGLRTVTFIVHLNHTDNDSGTEVELQMEGPDAQDGVPELLGPSLCKEVKDYNDWYELTDMTMHYNKEILEWLDENNMSIPLVVNKKNNSYVRGLVFDNDECAMRFKLRWLK